MNCPNCNTPVKETARFCPNCGQSLFEQGKIKTTRVIDLDSTQSEPPMESPIIPPIPSTVKDSSDKALGTQATMPEDPAKSQQSRILTSNEPKENKQIIKVLPGDKFTLSFYLIIFVSIAGLALLISGNFILAIMCGFFGYGMYKWSKKSGEGYYIPEKSFKTFRLTDKQLKPIFIILIVGGLLMIFVLANYSTNILSIKAGARSYWRLVLFACSLLLGGYYAYKALAVHGNVDHETNEFLSGALGVDVDEIIQVSTQTFDETEQELKDGDKLLVMTTRRIYFANFQQDHWIKCVEYLKDLNAIGLSHDGLNGAIGMSLSFNDDTSLDIDLDVSNKMTTTPSLFVKKFLETIDDHLLGRLPEKKSRRRRVTTKTERPSESSAVSQSIIKGITDAEQVSGRKLDL